MTTDFGIGFVLGVSTVLVTCAVFLWANRPLVRASQPFNAGPEQSEEPPLPVNPESLPRWMTYVPASLDHKAFCVCHGDRLIPGQKVLLWPPSASTPAKFFCEEGVAEAIQND